ncbi:hypothetical protein [Cryptosporangium japonicum]|uniref:Uncharacterized protein n=1 Tax=Cryptosporangium japonicum TaxID=80872 RepID=A0ABP3DXZ2_9ACTN
MANALLERTVWTAPAYLCATGLLVYAGQKAYYAAQGRLGIPGGASVPTSAYAELGHVAARQWTLASLGLLGAALALSTVFARRRLLLVPLWVALLPMLAGAPYLIATAGRETLGGLARGVAVTLLWLAMTWSYQVRSRPRR